MVVVVVIVVVKCTRLLTALKATVVLLGAEGLMRVAEERVGVVGVADAHGHVYAWSEVWVWDWDWRWWQGQRGAAEEEP